MEKKLADDIAFDPRDDRHRREPGTAFAELRSRCPVYRVRSVEPEYWAVSRSEDVERMTRDVEHWRSRRGQGLHYMKDDAGPLGGMDGPDHARQRAAINSYFLPKSLARIRPRIEALVDELFAAFSPKGRGDFVQELAYPLPALVVAEMLGVPRDDRDWFKIRSDGVLRMLDGDEEGVALGLVARAELTEYLDQRIDEALAVYHRDADGRDDLLFHMVRAWQRDGKLSRKEINDIGKIVLVAGHETTTSMIGLMMHRLIGRPDYGDRLRADPSLIPVFVEETLRIDGPVQGLFRTNPEPATLGGHEIAPETKVQLLFASANLDPERFEEPDRFSLDRDLALLKRRNLAFGIGPHVCIGAPVARLEGELALARMLSDLRDPVLDGDPVYVPQIVLRGYRHLPIRWTATASSESGGEARA